MVILGLKGLRIYDSNHSLIHVYQILSVVNKLHDLLYNVTQKIQMLFCTLSDLAL